MWHALLIIDAAFSLQKEVVGLLRSGCAGADLLQIPRIPPNSEHVRARVRAPFHLSISFLSKHLVN